MAKWAAIIESRVSELTNEVAHLKEELRKVQAEKEISILASQKEAKR